jgi:hypothetical protein
MYITNIYKMLLGRKEGYFLIAHGAKTVLIIKKIISNRLMELQRQFRTTADVIQ